MNILSIDTAAEILYVGVKTDKAFLENIRAMGLKHAETLIPLIRSMLKEIELSPGDLDLVVCSQGPGSFTGLRIGLATAKGISEGAGCPLVSIPTLDALAEPYRFLGGVVVPVIDAKKQRFYARLFQNGIPLTDPLDIAPEELAKRLKEYDEVFIVGPGADAFKEKIVHLPQDEDIIFLDPLGSSLSHALIRLGQIRLNESGPDKPESGPIYLRPSEAELGKQKGQGV